MKEIRSFVNPERARVRTVYGVPMPQNNENGPKITPKKIDVPEEDTPVILGDNTIDIDDIDFDDAQPAVRPQAVYGVQTPDGKGKGNVVVINDSPEPEPQPKTVYGVPTPEPEIVVEESVPEPVKPEPKTVYGVPTPDPVIVEEEPVPEPVKPEPKTVYGVPTPDPVIVEEEPVPEPVKPEPKTVYGVPTPNDSVTITLPDYEDELTVGVGNKTKDSDAVTKEARQEAIDKEKEQTEALPTTFAEYAKKIAEKYHCSIEEAMKYLEEAKNAFKSPFFMRRFGVSLSDSQLEAILIEKMESGTYSFVGSSINLLNSHIMNISNNQHTSDQHVSLSYDNVDAAKEKYEELRKQLDEEKEKRLDEEKAKIEAEMQELKKAMENATINGFKKYTGESDNS